MLVNGRSPQSQHRTECHGKYRPLPANRFPLVIIVALGTLLLAAGSQVVQAQSKANQNRQSIVEGLFRSLVDSEREGRVTNSSLSRDVPALAPRRHDPDPEMVQIRRTLASFAQEAGRLTAGLEVDLDRVPGVRPYFGDALQVRAAATVLADRSDEVQNRRLIQLEYQALDRDWRVLSYRLRQVQGLDRTCRQRIDRLDEFISVLGQSFEIKPQLNRTELIRQTTALTVDLQNLLEDIEIELEPGDQRTSLLLDGRKVQHQARNVSSTIADAGDHKTIVEDYRLFQRLWYPLAANLRPFENRYLERSVRRISHADRTTQELLWMPQQIDRQQLLHLTRTLEKEVDEFFFRAPLKLLIELPDADQVLSASDEFYGVFENFIDNVNRGEDHVVLVESFRYIDGSWDRFHEIFLPMKSRKAQEVLTRIERSVDTLRESMLINEGFDRGNAAELAASLENYSDHVHVLARRWLNERRPSYRSAALEESDAFVQASRRFHQSLASGSGSGDLRVQCAELYDNWRRVYSYISKCDTDDRPRLGRLASQITPALVELQTLLEL